MRESMDTVREAWVHEKGLPRVRRVPLVTDLGQRLLLATDLTSAARQAERRALEVARQNGARLLILAVTPPPAETGSSERRLGALMRLARRQGIDAIGWSAIGDPSRSVLDAAAIFGVDAIIMGADQWHTASGCPCGDIIRHAPCQVLVIGAP